MSDYLDPNLWYTNYWKRKKGRARLDRITPSENRMTVEELGQMIPPVFRG